MATDVIPQATDWPLIWTAGGVIANVVLALFGFAGLRASRRAADAAQAQVVEARQQTRIAEAAANRAWDRLNAEMIPKVQVYHERSGSYIALKLINTGSVPLSITPPQAFLEAGDTWMPIDRNSSEVRLSSLNGTPTEAGATETLCLLLEPDFPSRLRYPDPHRLGISALAAALGGTGQTYQLSVYMNYADLVITGLEFKEFTASLQP
ncbi:hypothetical protein [Deinococcus sp. UYEF24]